MADFYGRMAALAVRQIQKRGRTVQWVPVTTTPSSEAWKGAGVVEGSPVSMKGLFVDPRNSEKNFDFALKVRPDTGIDRVDWHVYLAAAPGFSPEDGDYVVDTSGPINAKYRVITASPVQPGDTMILWILQVQL